MQSTPDFSDPSIIQQALVHLQNQLKLAQEEIASLRSQQQTSASQQQASAPPNPQAVTLRQDRIKLPLPEKYSGKRTELRQFINAVKLQFSYAPHMFTSDQAKVGFVSSLLKAAALDWVTPYLETQDAILNNWQAFERALVGIFGDPNRMCTVTTKLSTLRQSSRSVAIYAAEFRKIAIDTDFDSRS